MRIKAHALSVIMTAAMIFINGACQKTETPQQEPEERTNFFTFEGYSLDINSVVRYDKGDNSVELWLSPEEGLNTIEEIKSAGDYVVLNTNASYIGGRDRFNAQSSKDSYIRFNEDLQYSYGDSGVAFIEVSVDNDQITIGFLAQNLYTKTAEKVEQSARIQGSYTGNFITEKEKEYINEWGFNRRHDTIGEVVITMHERDDEDWSVTILNKDGSEGIMITFPYDKLNQDIQVGSGNNVNDVKLYYNGGVEYSLKGASGWIKTILSSDEQIGISISLINGSQHLRAEYKGAFSTKLMKLNRYIYYYEGDSSYEGRHDIVKLMVENKGTHMKFYFSPSEGYSIGNANYTHMPILTVPKAIINEGKFLFMDLTDWTFEFDMMQVYPYEDEYRPHPSIEDYVIINHKNGEYEIDMMLNGVATNMNASQIDLYYKGSL